MGCSSHSVQAAILPHFTLCSRTNGALGSGGGVLDRLLLRREGELKGRDRGQETFRYLSKSRLILWKTAVLSHCQALCSTTQLVAVPAPLGKRCHARLHWPMLPMCLFLASKCAGAYKHSKDPLFSRELCFPRTA